jgi:hypothetical protein
MSERQQGRVMQIAGQKQIVLLEKKLSQEAVHTQILVIVLYTMLQRAISVVGLVEA